MLMSNEEMFEQGKKTKDQEYAEMKINAVIRSMKGRDILFYKIQILAFNSLIKTLSFSE